MTEPGVTCESAAGASCAEPVHTPHHTYLVIPGMSTTPMCLALRTPDQSASPHTDKSPYWVRLQRARGGGDHQFCGRCARPRVWVWAPSHGKSHHHRLGPRGPHGRHLRGTRQPEPTH